MHDYNHKYYADEKEVVTNLLNRCAFFDQIEDKVHSLAVSLVSKMRDDKEDVSMVSQLMNKYQLSSKQGITLMCLAEALLRIPDNKTADLLIHDKLVGVNWSATTDSSDSLLIKGSNLALRLVSSIVGHDDESNFLTPFKRLLAKGSEPVIRNSIKQGMKLLANQFILGRDIEEAIKKSKNKVSKGFTYSYDMLGEVALTQHDADRYFKAYKDAIKIISGGAGQYHVNNPCISVKLSAIHPRYHFAQRERVVDEVSKKLLELCIECKKHNIGLTVDAEEADVLEISLDIIKNVALNPLTSDWDGFGLAVQAYQKRSWDVIEWVKELAEKSGKKIRVRLVKGAYWDTEIKRAQERGLENYPVFTHKSNTDVSYLACAQKLLDYRDYLYPKFATHNAHTVASILQMVPEHKGFEFQMLHGMGESLYKHIVGPSNYNITCRIYAPVGSHNDLLAYLVRRLLENGANSSFVHSLANKTLDINKLVENPIKKATERGGRPHSQIVLPRNMYPEGRINSMSLDLSLKENLEPLNNVLENHKPWIGGPVIHGKLVTSKQIDVTSPTDRTIVVGKTTGANVDDVAKSFDLASQAFDKWTNTPVTQRAAILDKIADLYEDNLIELMAICISEAGKTIPDALDEVREAVDFCRYYAQIARDMIHDTKMPGPTGQLDKLTLHGRGVFVCISPWNFPLAIFTGQITAALVSGNCVLAKPASSTTLIATKAIQLMYKAGIPKDVIHLVPGNSKEIGDSLLMDPCVAGVAITGSVDTGKTINQKLASKDGPIVPLIAETGGLNVMFVDSSALPEQVVKDVVSSAFQSAGQRCSALRVLLVQEDVADKIIEMLAGAMKELNIGDPQFQSTDVGPVIDESAKSTLDEHIVYLNDNAKLIYKCELDQSTKNGTFVPPCAYEISGLNVLRGEKFGPILHVLRFKSDKIKSLIDEVNQLGYGLTLGIHSRCDSNIDLIFNNMKVGNTYVNRNIIGAVVGVQPFGGEGLSGTGPKAGGPHYLLRFITERTISINTTAQGGNTALMMLED